MLSKVFLLTVLMSGLSGVALISPTVAKDCCDRETFLSSLSGEAQFINTVPQPGYPVLLATAYTDLSLPTLRRGDRGRSVQQLQKILSDNGFLGAAGVRLGNPQGAVVDGVFGPITESAVRDLQQRYKVPVTGQANPRTWEVLDMYENPYRSPLPWKL